MLPEILPPTWPLPPTCNVYPCLQPGPCTPFTCNVYPLPYPCLAPVPAMFTPAWLLHLQCLPPAWPLYLQCLPLPGPCTCKVYCRYLEKGSNYKNIVLRYFQKSEFFQKRFCHWFKRRLCSVILSQRVDNGVGLKVI